MSLRREIEARLGIFARPETFGNCGIGANGFEPGNTCGKESGGGSSGGSDASKPARGIEERAKAAGKSFTEQYLQEARADIDREHAIRERRRQRAGERKQAKAEEKVREIERRLAEVKAAGPKAAAPKGGEAIKALETEQAAIRAKQAALAESKAKRDAEQAKSDAATKARIEEVRKKWTKMFGPKKAEDMIAKTFKSKSARPNRTNR